MRVDATIVQTGRTEIDVWATVLLENVTWRNSKEKETFGEKGQNEGRNLHRCCKLFCFALGFIAESQQWALKPVDFYRLLAQLVLVVFSGPSDRIASTVRHSEGLLLHRQVLFVCIVKLSDYSAMPFGINNLCQHILRCHNVRQNVILGSCDCPVF